MALETSPYPIDQESGRKAEHDLGWDGFGNPLLQSRFEVRHIQSPLSKSALEFRDIQFRNGFNHQVIINYP